MTFIPKIPSIHKLSPNSMLCIVDTVSEWLEGAVDEGRTSFVRVVMRWIVSLISVDLSGEGKKRNMSLSLERLRDGVRDMVDM